MTLHDRYEASLVAMREARSAMLSDRLTLSRKQAQMHEADVEQDDSVAEYFADRVAEMERRVAADEEHIAALARIAEEVRIAMVTNELAATVVSYNVALQATAAHLATLEHYIAHLKELSQRAEEQAGMLPASATIPHQAAETAARQTMTIEEGVQDLRALLTALVPPLR